MIKLMHGANETVAEYSYDAWGSVLNATGSFAAINPLRYRGYYYDTETGFYYLQSRYYDPIVKRFLNADSYASTRQGFLGYNMFAYCINNPIHSSDDSGQMSRVTVINVKTEKVSSDDEKVVYKTTIDYKLSILPGYHIFFPEVFRESVDITFSVDNGGVASIDNREIDNLLLNDDSISYVMANEIINTAKSQVEGAMSGRTVKGVAREIRFHCKWGFILGINDIAVADIGGMDISRTDYDYNAKGFEDLWCIPFVVREKMGFF